MKSTETEQLETRISKECPPPDVYFYKADEAILVEEKDRKELKF